MKPSLELEKHREAIRELVHKYGLHNPRIFGSVAKGTDTEVSDLDLLVDAEKKTSLFDMGGLHEELSALLSCPVHGGRLGNGQYCTVSLFFEQAKSSQ